MAALRRLARRLEGVELDLTDAARDQADYYTGKKDEKYRKDMRARLARDEERVRARTVRRAELDRSGNLTRLDEGRTP